MTVSRTIEQEDLAPTLKAWLIASDIPLTMPLELFFLPGEVIIRPQPPEQQELIEWFVDGNKHANTKPPVSRHRREAFAA